MIEKGFHEICRKAAADGAVLLKNENHMLPIRNEKIALFGRHQIDYYPTGSGSGGFVNCNTPINFLDAFRQNDFINVDEELASLYTKLTHKHKLKLKNRFEEDFSDTELKIDENAIIKVSKRCKKAIIIIGRICGEAYDNKNLSGSYLLNDTERQLIKNVSMNFDNVAVLLNVSNIIDMSWVEEYGIDSVMYLWHGGEAGCEAAADLVSGIISPSGKLTDTIAKSINDYPSTQGFFDKKLIYNEDIFVGYRYFNTFAPEKILYPFGFGLSYCDFEVHMIGVLECNGRTELSFEIKNIGQYPAREVVEIYLEPPKGKLARPVRELAAFAKTELLNPGETTHIRTGFDIANTSAFDDKNAAWTLESGTYKIYAGNNIQTATQVYSYAIFQSRVTRQVSHHMQNIEEFSRLTIKDGVAAYETVPANTSNVVYEPLPKFTLKTYDLNFKQALKKNKLCEFVSQLSDEDLIVLSRGEGMNNPRVRKGNASCFGGLTESLSSKGIPLVCTSDGPSGLHLLETDEKTTCMPSATLLACTWDVNLVQELYTYEGREARLNDVDMLLGPGMNIHRNPLCGRNFEYYSEDPLISGNMAAAVVRGVHNGGAMAVIKHFACNNRETNRFDVDTILSERALREIYLKGFNTAIKTSPIKAIMTSYNKINGYHSSSNYELTTSILRSEWGFDGMVMTDWFANMSPSRGTKGNPHSISKMVAAQNDIYMVIPNGSSKKHKDDLSASLKDGSITRRELCRNALNILKVISILPRLK